MIGKEILMTSVRRCTGSSSGKSDLTTNFRWPDMHFELSSCGLFFFYPRQELSSGIVVSGKKMCPSGGL